jgi:hypothetical protein
MLPQSQVTHVLLLQLSPYHSLTLRSETPVSQLLSVALSPHGGLLSVFS